MNLAVFDIDDTLTITRSIDDECYLTALALEFSITGCSPDWENYESSTDSGLAEEILRTALGGAVGEEKIGRLKARFVSLLERASLTEPDRFPAALGAAELLRGLCSDGRWGVAIATGAWRESAEIKLRASGLDSVASSLPIACADDSPHRERIVELAVERAREKQGVDGFSRVVYLGDGVWDARACRGLGIPFVGVAHHRNRIGLVREGASHVVGGFESLGVVMEALEHAMVPGQLDPGETTVT